MIIEMEPTAHLSYSNPKQPDVAAANIGKGHRRLVADLRLTSSLASKGKDAAGDGELGWKGAYVRFGNTEPGLLNLVKGRGKYSPSGATAAAVAEEEDEVEEEEAEPVEDWGSTRGHVHRFQSIVNSKGGKRYPRPSRLQPSRDSTPLLRMRHRCRTNPHRHPS